MCLIDSRWLYCLVTMLSFFGSCCESSNTNDAGEKPANVIMIMVDDFGRTDIGSYGSEWPTPNIDSFASSSITLSRHYVGYVCSASRSQFLTGRYSFHNGYGTLNVFDVNRLGAIPQNTPTLMEYLSKEGNYKTYGIGKWQLGSITDTHLPFNRGFDTFVGFNGGLEGYFDKTASGYLDFWQDLELTSDYSDAYSTDQYFDETIKTLERHRNMDNSENIPFFMYVGLQATHTPFPTHVDSEITKYYEFCLEKYGTEIEDFDDRVNVCEGILGIDAGMGQLMEYFDKIRKSGGSTSLWDNTIIILTSDNGGAINSGSCNYPLRGGKNTFWEGGQRILTFVGGGKIDDSQRGSVLDGLISNVDWFPTILSFAQLIPKESTHVRFDLEYNDNYDQDKTNKLTLELDGYNMHNYLLGYSTQPIRDHILFHIKPKLDDTNYWLNDNEISNYRLNDMDEIAIIFYDENGYLWKYFDVTMSKNEIGDPKINTGWCELNDGKYSVYSDEYSAVSYGLFELTNDISERLNYFQNDDNKALLIHKLTSSDEIDRIVNEKIAFYVNQDNKGNQNSKFLFGDFECFTDSITVIQSFALFFSLFPRGFGFVLYSCLRNKKIFCTMSVV